MCRFDPDLPAIGVLYRASPAIAELSVTEGVGTKSGGPSGSEYAGYRGERENVRVQPAGAMLAQSP